MKKIFGGTNITWKFLIIFSIIIGIAVGIINKIPAIQGTSFQDIAVVLDVWIILAIFIIVNCKSAKEAVLKCFLFFLISQPLIYCIEAVIDTIVYNNNFIEKLAFYFKQYYIGAKWLHWTILTIPGSFIAYQIKKDNILAALILSVATCYYGAFGTYNLLMGYHYISCIFCFAMAILLIFVILSKKRERIIAIVLTIVAVIIAVFMYNKTIRTPIYENVLIDLDSGMKIVEVKIEDEQIANYSLESETTISFITSTKIGNTKAFVTDEENNVYIYNIESTYKGLKITKDN